MPTHNRLAFFYKKKGKAKGKEIAKQKWKFQSRQMRGKGARQRKNTL